MDILLGITVLWWAVMAHQVRDGTVEHTEAYFTNGEKVGTLSSSWDSIADKKYKNGKPSTAIFLN